MATTDILFYRPGLVEFPYPGYTNIHRSIGFLSLKTKDLSHHLELMDEIKKMSKYCKIFCNVITMAPGAVDPLDYGRLAFKLKLSPVMVIPGIRSEYEYSFNENVSNNPDCLLNVVNFLKDCYNAIDRMWIASLEEETIKGTPDFMDLIDKELKSRGTYEVDIAKLVDVLFSLGVIKPVEK